jgi:hypothetical protein
MPALRPGMPPLPGMADDGLGERTARRKTLAGKPPVARGVTEYWIPAFAGMTSGALTVDEGMPALRSGMPPDGQGAGRGCQGLVKQ